MADRDAVLREVSALVASAVRCATPQMEKHVAPVTALLDGADWDDARSVEERLRALLTATARTEDGQDAETAAYMARRAVCRRCGDLLVPSPTIIGMWLTDRKGIGRGLCPDGSAHDAERTDGGAPTAGEDAATAAGEEE